MKKRMYLMAVLLTGLTIVKAQNNLGINNPNPPASAALMVDTAATGPQGILIPRMTQARRNVIATPANGLMIYQTDGTSGFYFYNGTAWTALKEINGQGVPIGGTANQVLAKIDGTDFNTQWIAAPKIPLEEITTASGAKSYRLSDRVIANYGVIGNDAVDLSYSDQAGINGATGNGTFTAGYNNKAQGDGSTALGVLNTASGLTSTALGVSNTASGQASTVSGFLNTAAGDAATSIGAFSNATGIASVTLGAFLNAKSAGEVVVGTGNTDYTPADATSFNSADRAFVVGIGEVSLGGITSQKDGLIVYKDGTLALDKLTSAPATVQNRLYVLNDTLHYNGTALGGSGGGSGWSLTGNAGTTPSSNFIGTTDNTDLRFRTNNITRWTISQNGRLFNNTTSGNVFISAGNETTTGASNTAVGTGAMVSNTTGNYNAAFGESVLSTNTTGIRNTAVGGSAMGVNTDGAANVAVGFSALAGNTTGNANIAIGQNSLLSNTTGSNNTALGFQANVSANNLSNATAIGNGAIVNASNKMRLGNDNVTATDIAGQVKVNAQSTTNDFTLPNTRGTANQVLTTNGTGGTSWATASGGATGAQVALIATKTTNAQVLANANSTNLGDLVTFDNVVTQNTTYGTYNASTNTFTVSQAGVYVVQAVTRAVDNASVSSTVGHFLFVDVDNAGLAGVDNILPLYLTMTGGSNMPAQARSRGFTSVILNLTAGQTINIKGLTANSAAVGTALKTDQSCKFMIFKM